MAEGVRPRSVAGCTTHPASPYGARGDGILAHSAARHGCSANALPPPIALPRGSGVGEVQFLLMPQQQISPSEASRTLGTLERLLLGM